MELTDILSPQDLEMFELVVQNISTPKENAIVHLIKAAYVNGRMAQFDEDVKTFVPQINNQA